MCTQSVSLKLVAGPVEILYNVIGSGKHDLLIVKLIRTAIRYLGSEIITF